MFTRTRYVLAAVLVVLAAASVDVVAAQAAVRPATTIAMSERCC